MTTETFLGGLIVLTLVAALVAAMTSTRRDGDDQREDDRQSFRGKSGSPGVSRSRQSTRD